MSNGIYVSKRTLLAFVAIVVVAAIAGAAVTYAWFSGVVDSGQESFQLGDLIVSSTFATEEENVYYEPGLTVYRDGVLTNEGTIEAFVQVSLSPTTTIKSDVSGSPLPPYQYETVVNDSNIAAIFDEDKLGYLEEEDGSFYWFIDSEGNYYVLLAGVASAGVSLETVLDGENMGNDYRNAEISFASSWKVSQALRPAIESTFDIDYDDLVFCGNDLGGGIAPFSANSSSGAEARARAILEQL